MRTIAATGRAELTVQRSRFLAAAARVDDATAARAFAAERRRSHHAAAHHATAWILGPHGDHYRRDDDGEPSGTAGAPLLSALSGRDLTDTVVVVTRYFGGVKLGTGGLVRAYGDAAAAALDSVATLRLYHAHTMTVTCGHATAGRLESAIRAAGHTVTATRYTTSVHIDVAVTDPDAFTAWITALADTTVTLGPPVTLTAPT